MGHGVTWFSLLPGYRQLEAYLQHEHAGLLFGNVLVLQHVAGALLVFFLVILLAWRARRDLRRLGEAAIVPGPEPSVRNALDVVLETLYRQMRAIIGGEVSRYFPVIATLALFIFFSNLLGLIPGFVPPTNTWNTTAACSIFVFFYYNWQGIRAHGLGHVAHLANPIGEWWGWFLAPLLFPIEIVSHLARPFSLAVRLTANMVGDHAVLAAFLGLVPLLVPLPFLALGLIVAIVQTLVFVLLSVIYIALAVEGEHEEHGHHGRQEAKA